MIAADDPNGQLPPYIKATASIHGCGDDDHDPFWLLRPGESRFDSFELETVPKESYDLAVDVDIVERVLGSTAAPCRRTLSWKGRLSDAVALGRELTVAPSQ
jgi:hypothetical protein